MSTGARLLGAIVVVLVTCSGAAGAVGPPRTADGGNDGTGGDAAGLGRMILLLDASGSMAEPAGGGQTKIQAARAALRTVIDGLPDEAQVGLRVFGAQVFSRKDKGACTDSQLVVPPAADNRSDLTAAVGDYKPYGETPIPYALQQAAKDLGDEGARSIVLVSDGESTCSPDPCKVAADLERGGIDLQIDVVGLSVSGAAREQLQCIAENGNGHYYDARSAGDIESGLVRVASRAVRPFTLDGRPIEGGPEEDPTPITVGDWLDTIGAANATKSYVFERTTAGTTIRVSAVTQGEHVYSDGLGIKLSGPDGAQCDAGVVTRSLDLRDLIGVEALATGRVDVPDGGPCAQPGAYVITVRRSAGADHPVPLALRVTEEPPVSDPGFVDTATEDPQPVAPAVSGPAQKVEGGVSFATAAEIGAGRWSSTIVPGEALMYRLHLDFGQSLRVGVRFPRQNAEIKRLFSSGFPALAQVLLFNPMRTQLPPPDMSKAYGGPDGITLLSATAAVSRSAVEARGGAFDIGQHDVSLAGDYYVMVSLNRQDYTPILPFDIDVEVVGDAADGPVYADGSDWSVAADLGADEAASPGPDSDATAEPGGSAAAADGEDADDDESADDDSAAVLVVGGVVAGVAVGAIITLLVLRRRRRAA